MKNCSYNKLYNNIGQLRCIYSNLRRILWIKFSYTVSYSVIIIILLQSRKNLVRAGKDPMSSLCSNTQAQNLPNSYGNIPAFTCAHIWNDDFALSVRDSIN